jgi:site-specific DNA recombinase
MGQDQGDNAMARVLIATRISSVDNVEDASRIERDREKLTRWAGMEDHEIVAVTEDRNVSGSVTPFERPSLGPWLTEPSLVAQYDEIVATSIDRLGRNARDLMRLQEWSETNGKVLRIVSDTAPLVWPAEGFAKAMWALIAVFAEMEWDVIKARQDGARATIKDNGGMMGKAPFGFEVHGPKYGKTLIPDDRLVAVLHEMVRRAQSLDRKENTLRSIGKWLDSEGILPVAMRPPVSEGVRETVKGPPLSGAWSQTSVSHVLRSPSLKGRRMSEDGQTIVLRHDGIMTSAEWAKLQAALDSRSQSRGKATKETALLTSIIRCAQCAGGMYKIKTFGGFSYRCKGTDQVPSTCKNLVPMDAVEGWVNDWFAGQIFGSVEITETVTIPGDDHKAEIAEVEAELRELDQDSDDYDRKHSLLRSERSKLLSLPSEPTRVIERPTGQTVADVWQSLDVAGRRAYMMASGIKVMVRPSPLNETEGPWYDAEYPTATGVPVAFYSNARHAVWLVGDPARITGTLQGIEAS